MIRTFTAAEVSSVYGMPLGSVYRAASTEKWHRSDDGRWPVLYNGDDVEVTMERRIDQLRAEIDRLTSERNGYRDEVNRLRKVVIAAMAWRSVQWTVAERVAAAQLSGAVDEFNINDRMVTNSPEIAT